MAEVVVVVLSKIASSLTQAGVSTLFKEISSVKELTSKVNNIRTELKVMNDFILDIGYHNIGDRGQWTEWIGEVRNMAYNAEDVMDKYSYHAVQWEEEGRFNKVVKSSMYGSVLRGLCVDIAIIEKKLELISGIKHRWLHADVLPSLIEKRVAQEQRTQNCFNDFVEDKYLVGMDDKRDELVKWLNSEEKSSMVIIVSGIGGLGKSNMVWNVHESQVKEKNFDVYAWVVLSKTYNAGDLLRKLIHEINGKNESPSDLDGKPYNELKKELEKAVKGKKCMVVVDDVWDDGPYNDIHDAFQTLQNASRIIMTTRKSDGLAARSLMRRSLEFQPLNDEDAHHLFRRESSLDTICPQGFTDVAETVVKRCGNHPLAIISIAKQLSVMPRKEIDWKDACNELQSLLAKDDHVLAVLHRTYNNLDKDIRNCFLYCSLFPEGYSIRRECIVRMWVAEGLVTWKEGNTPEIVAEKHMRNMIHHNMLRPDETDEFGSVVTCKMDPILRVLALSISEASQFGVANDHYRMEQSDGKVRRLSACLTIDKHSSNTKCPHLRTLIAAGPNTVTTDKLRWFFAESVYLAVLDLQHSSIEVVPASVGNLFNLCYLGLRYTKVKSLPRSIRKLVKLQTLDLKSTNIEKLPKGIRKLSRLRHLFANRDIEKTEPESKVCKGVTGSKWLSCLEDLQTLETIEASIEFGKHLEKLEQLRSLCIDNVKACHCKDLFRIVLKKPYLSSLHVSASDLKEKLCAEDVEMTSMELQKLIIRGCLAEGILRNFIFKDPKNKIKYLSLSSCQFEDDPLQLLAEHLPELSCLSFNNVECKPDLVLKEGKFRFLNTLILKGMTSVQKLTIEDGAIPTVEALVLDKMPMIKKVPSGFLTLRALKKLWLLGLASEFKTEWDVEGWQQKLTGNLDIRVEG